MKQLIAIIVIIAAVIAALIFLKTPDAQEAAQPGENLSQEEEDMQAPEDINADLELIETRGFEEELDSLDEDINTL